MSQNYTIKDVKKGSITKDSYAVYQNYGIALQEFGEPVKLTRVVGNPIPEIGEVLYGDLVEFEANNRTYYRFQLATKPEMPPMTTQEAIMSQWSIGQAVQVWIAQGCQLEAYDNIQLEAKHFYEMINNIRGEA